MRLSSTTARLTSLFTIGWNNPIFTPVSLSRLRYRPRIFFGTSIGSSTLGSTEEEDLLRWERMYAEGMQSASRVLGIEDENPNRKTAVRSKVNIVTFDLDNTLWNTSATIGTANDALAAHITLQSGNDDPAKNVTRVEKRMRALHQAEPDRYGPAVSATTTASKDPVRLTDLRKDAIRSVLIDEAGYTDDDSRLESAVDEAFGIWSDARHGCIPDHFASSGVVECLKALRRSTDIVAIGAITDGNSNPLAIPELRGYIDFCINAEQVGISKPDRRVYQRAVRHVLETNPSLREKVQLWGDDDDDGDVTVDAVGPWWVHVGDDFVKDVVAAKEIGMRTIWSRELVMDKLQVEQKRERANNGSRDVETFVKEISKMEIIKMEIGADDYLLESLRNEFADDIVDRFIDVAQTIDRWQTEAADEPFDEGVDAAKPGTPTQTDQLADRTTVDGLPVQPVHVLSPKETVESDQTSEEGMEFKFCIFCGTNLPAVAKFCSSCGGKQP